MLFSPERQPTAASVAGAFAVLFLPYSLVGPFAGVFLDEWRRRQVLVYANLLRGALVITVAALVWMRHDGLDLAGLDLAAVRRQLGAVLQNSQLLNGTVYDNIAGTSRMTMDEAMEAARLCGLEDDVKAVIDLGRVGAP